jgi:hypothetical protein
MANQAPGAPPVVLASTAPGHGDAPRPRRRWVWKRRRNHGPPTPSFADSGEAPSLALSDDDCLAIGADHPRWPRWVLTRSVTITQWEENLAGRALVLSVIADTPDDLVDSIMLPFA